VSELVLADVGNTNTRIGLWRQGAVHDVRVLPTASACPDGRLSAGLEREIAALNADPRAPLVLCSAVPAAGTAWLRWAEADGRPALLVRGDTPAPLPNRYRRPRQLGGDRLAAAVAAVRRLGAPAIVASLGTATVVDAVSPAGEFLGGAIAAGVEAGLRALADLTAALPRLAPGDPPGALGADTEECMQAGAVVGAAALVEGIADRLRAQVGAEAPLALTGGHAERVSPHLRAEHHLFPALSLEGVALIWEHLHGAG